MPLNWSIENLNSDRGVCRVSESVVVGDLTKPNFLGIDTQYFNIQCDRTKCLAILPQLDFTSDIWQRARQGGQ
jgi:hypothetical protein